MRFLVEQVEFDFDYDFRGWILPNGNIVSTNNAPHYTKETNELNIDTIKYNFGYERYIGLPNKITSQQYKTLELLLDNYFVGKENVGELSSKIEINCDIDNKGDFISKRYSPFEYTTDDIIRIIKRYYTSGHLYEDLTTATYHAYHGARKDFERFEQEFIGSHALEHGYGFYFTSEIEQAKSYGDYIIEADLIIRNPFSTEEITITRNQVKEYIRKYIDSTGETYLTNYGWYKDIGYENVLDECVNSLFIYNNNDNDILSEILPWVQNKYNDEAYDAIFEIFGKDGIIYKGYSEWDSEPLTNYIVYSNSQITNRKKIKLSKEINESKINNTPVLIPNKEDNIELYNKLDLSSFKSNIRCIRDNCGPIAWDLYDYLKREGYEPKIIRGEFKTDNLNLLDKNDLTKEERSLYKALYSDKFTNKMIIEFINDQIPDLINDFYYLPHTWIKLDGLILDPSYRMFNKGLDKPITKYNYIEGRNGNN